MSRCFPFPPPGYEKKIRTDEADPLVKDKYKEKKHKKDKEKKEGKEKKSKDRSKDKQKERKEKKDKHKDRKDKEKDKEKSKPLEDKKAEVLTNSGHREKLVTNTVQNNSNGESKYVQDLARRIRYDEEATGSQSAQKIDYSHPKNSGITGQAFENSPIEETSHRVDDDKRINTTKNFAAAKSSKNATSRVYFGADQKRTEVMSKPMENKDQVRQTESAEKSHRKQNVTKSDKPRDQEGVKKNDAKDKDRIKEKKEENIESINKTRQEKPKIIGGSRLEEREKDYQDIRNSKPPDLSRASVKNVITEGNLGKRKDHETNGFLYGELFPDPILCLVNEECSCHINHSMIIWLGT
ncbi:myb-like protein X isoform X2 [Capsella rubella]|uniref:myb-like protein X isoform X2 n=1 Tax=Capsella rubella TaxID=81985 RepID=UPI000CD5A1A2|nr:myb-like protein X isoform X2 [Capsella rubella]